MVITEEFCTLFLKLFALVIFLRGFSVVLSAAVVLINDGYSIMSDGS